MEIGVMSVEHDVAGLDHELAALAHGIARIDRHVDDGALKLPWIGQDRPNAGGKRG